MSEVTYPALVAQTVRAAWDGPERTGNKTAALFPVNFLCGICMTWHLEHAERAGFSVYTYYGIHKVHIRVFRSGVPMTHSLQMLLVGGGLNVQKTGGMFITVSDGINRSQRFYACMRLGPKTSFDAAIKRVINVCNGNGSLWLEDVLRPRQST